MTLTTSTQMNERLEQLFQEKVLPLGKICAVVTCRHAVDEVPIVKGFNAVHNGVNEYGNQILFAMYPFSDIEMVALFIKKGDDSSEVKYVMSAGPFEPVGADNLETVITPLHADEEQLDQEEV